MPEIDYAILGPLTVRLAVDAEPLALGEKVKLLLARLLIAPGSAVTVETLGDDVWGDDVELSNVRNTVHAAVRQLRQRLGDTGDTREVVVNAGAGYRLVSDPLWIDAERVKLLAHHGRDLIPRHPRAARAMLDEALASWRGPFLGDFAGLTWAAAAAAEMNAIRDAVEVDGNEVRLALGDHARLEASLRRQLVERPTDERRHAQLLRVLEAMGRTAESGLAYRRAVQFLGFPGPELRALGDRIGSGREAPPPDRSPGGLPTRPSGDVLVHAILGDRGDDRARRPEAPGLGTAALIVHLGGGEPHPEAHDRLTATFDALESGVDAATRLAADPRLRCRVGLHVGAITQLGDRLVGPGPPRCRLLADAAHPAQVLMSADARSRWSASDGIRDLGEQRYEDLLPGEPVHELVIGTAAEPSPMPQTLTRRPHNLPVQRTRFVGRDRELAAISRFATPGEVITLVGAGGCGKTRLALQLAARRIAAFEDGAWFAGLADLEPGAGADAVAQAMVHQVGARAGPGETMSAALLRHFSDRSAMLVVDNCEHVLAACREVVAGLHAVCPRVCVLATSRERLRLDGERVVEVPAMATEAVEGSEMLSDAAELLLERAGALPDAGGTTGDVIDDLTSICRALEGSPLAIELAAGHVATRGVEGVATDVRAMLAGKRGLGFLASDDPHRAPRQRTIEATIAWSHALLAAPERAVLHQLAVFRGSFGVSEAVLVAGEGSGRAETTEILDRLVERSMVSAEPPLAGDARLRLGQPIRAFAHRELERSGRLEATRRRHVEVYRALAAEVAPMLFGPEEQTGLERLGADHDNLRAALACLIEERRAHDALALVGAMWWLWFSRGHLAEGGAGVSAVLALDDRPSRRRVRALRVGSHLAWWRGELAETARYNAELEACARAIDDAWGLAWAPMGHGAVRMFGDPAGALPLLEASRRRFEALGAEWEAGYALQLIGGARWFAGEEEPAGAAYEEAVCIFERLQHGSVLASARRGAGLMAALRGQRARGAALCAEALRFSEAIGDRAGSAQALNFLAAIGREEGDVVTAAVRYGEALVRAREIGELWATCSALDGLAGVACAFDEPELAATLFGRSDALARRSGYQRSPHERRLRDADERKLRAALDPEDAETALAEGEGMSTADAVASAAAFVRRLRGSRDGSR